MCPASPGCWLLVVGLSFLLLESNTSHKITFVLNKVECRSILICFYQLFTETKCLVFEKLKTFKVYFKNKRRQQNICIALSVKMRTLVPHGIEVSNYTFETSINIRLANGLSLNLIF